MNTIILIKKTKARGWGALSRKANRKLADTIQHADKAGSATLKKNRGKSFKRKLHALFWPQLAFSTKSTFPQRAH